MTASRKHRAYQRMRTVMKEIRVAPAVKKHEVGKVCAVPACIKSAGIKWCDEHKSQKYCLNDECTRRATYGVVGGGPTHCSQHGKALQLQDVKHVRCEHADCNTRPSCGQPGGPATHCATHGLILNLVDVVSKRCKNSDCNIRPSYGQLGGPATHCAPHGQVLGLQDVVSRRRCEHFECETRASYGQSWQRPTHCAQHGLPLGLQDVVTKKCVHGRVLSQCLGYACGIKLGGKSVQELHVTAAVHLFKEHNDSSTDPLPEYIKCLDQRINLPDGRHMKPDMVLPSGHVYEFDGNFFHCGKFEDDTRKTQDNEWQYFIIGHYLYNFLCLLIVAGFHS